MKKFLLSKVSFVITCLMCVLFNASFFIIADLSAVKAGGWIGYAGMMLSFVVMLLITFFFKLKSKNALTVVWPIMYVTLVYFVLSVILNLIFILTNSLDFALPTVINLALVILYAILLLVSYKSFARVEDKTSNREQRVKNLRETAIKVGGLANFTEDSDVITAIKKLRENVDYSPTSTEATLSYDVSFDEQITAINDLLTSNVDKEVILKAIKTADNILKMRNQMALVSRK